MTLSKPDCPPALTNLIWVSFDIHHFTMSRDSLMTSSLFHVVRTNGCPPMFDHRLMEPSAWRVPGGSAKSDLSATFDSFGLMTGPITPTQSTIAPTLPCI